MFFGLKIAHVEQLLFIKLLGLLRHKLLDPERVNDLPYLFNAIKTIDTAQGLEYRLYLTTEDEFIEQARAAYKAKALSAAVVLCFTAIEHITNFYVRLFSELKGLSPKQIDKMLQACHHDDKLTWLAALLGLPVPTKMLTEINGLRAVRNKIVHSPEAPGILRHGGSDPGSVNENERRIAGLKMRCILTLPDRLRNYLEPRFQKQHPDFAVAELMLKNIINERRRVLRLNAAKRKKVDQ